VRLANLPLTPGKELDAALRERIPLYRGEVPLEGGMTEQVRQALQAMLAAKGLKCAVTATPYAAAQQAQISAMSYSISNPSVHIGEIHLTGVSPEMQNKVRLAADHVMKDDYDTMNTASNIEHNIALLYADEGFATVKVHAEPSDKPTVGDSAIHIPFNVTVEEGRHFKLGAIHLPSGELLNLAEINKAIGVVLKANENQSIKGGVTLRIALLFVTGQYKSKGYMDCVVTPHPQFDEASGIVNYTLEVQPGPVYTMGKLIIENGADDLRTAMLAAWKMPEGAVFNEKAISDYFYSQGNTPLGRTFASVNCKYKLAKDSDTRTINVTLRLERKQ
jgi:outer membrane protein assembly factor BamA